MTFENRYTRSERLLHRLAFRTGPAQIALADIEDRMFRSTLAAITPSRPVFITALPRAGTTLLLDLCDKSPEFTSHHYSDMPFLLIPMLWKRFSTGFRRIDMPRERAHGDGVMINTESPEAFEEMIWKQFWPEHYADDRIRPWGGEDHPEFFAFMRSHIRKIVAVHRRGAPDRTARYVSKNNLNIARIGLLLREFPDGVVVVPFRHPMQHAASLLRQHLNFLEVHRSDPFAREYMEAIGHYDFGANLRPVDFAGWLDNGPRPDPTGLSFWLEYWIAAYRHLLGESRGNRQIHLLSYERLCSAPESGLERFAGLLGAVSATPFIESAATIHTAAPHPTDSGDDTASDLILRATALHTELLAASAI